MLGHLSVFQSAQQGSVSYVAENKLFIPPSSFYIKELANHSALNLGRWWGGVEGGVASH